MLLDNKTAIIYGAAGAIGSAVAHAYAREGAEVHLAGRTDAALEKVAQRIQRDGGNPHVTQLDVLDRPALERHAATVAAASGGIDVCFNATSNDDRQGTPLLDMQFEDFLRHSGTPSPTAGWSWSPGPRRRLRRHRGHLLRNPHRTDPNPQRRTPSNRLNHPNHFDIDADLRRRHGHLRARLQRPARVAHPARARHQPIAVYGRVTPPSSGD